MKRILLHTWRPASLALAVSVLVGGTAATTDRDASTAEAASPAAEQPASTETTSATPEAAPVAVPFEYSKGMGEIIRLARSGADGEVLDAYIAREGREYHPSIEEIIYLQDLGVAPETIAALIRTGDPDSSLASELVEESSAESLAPEPEPAGEALPPGQTAAPDVEYAAAPSNATMTTAAPDAGTTNITYQYFYESLSPYGQWVDVDGYGRVWRPTVAMRDRGWQPYADSGRWIYSDHGWYWLSDYSWGWAPFHYGRWHDHNRFGWVWVPGYTWGPAWVVWRSGRGYHGWAPLPPHHGTSVGVSWSSHSGWGVGISFSAFTWVPTRYCYGYYPKRHRVTHVTQVQEIYRDSTVIKPTIIGDNNTIIINGPQVTTVEAAAKTQIRAVAVEDAPVDGAKRARETLNKGGDSITVFRPGHVPDAGARAQVATASRSTGSGRATPSATTVGRTTIGQQSEASAVRRNAVLAPRNSDSRPALVTTTTSASGQASSRSQVSARTTVTPQRSLSSTPTPASEPVPILRNGRSLTISERTSVSRPVIGNQAPRPSTSTYWQQRSQTLNTVRPNNAVNPARTFNAPTASGTVNSSRTFTRPSITTRDSSSPALDRPATQTIPGRSFNTPQFNTRTPSNIQRAPSATPSRPTFNSPRSVTPSRSPAVSPRTQSAPSIRSTPSPAPSRAVSAPSVRSAPAASNPRSSGNASPRAVNR